ncbi:MAG: tRNA (N6-threonylcarbamoyladenosine(37)-N6)-methyltransferase TrmO [Planctomycetota bacterium]|jgi:tRNA-Thr(GGU) m(6)t(6)A37 methyltransferase TsaA
MVETNFTIEPIGIIRSELASKEDAPNQGFEGAPDAWLEVNSKFIEGLEGTVVGKEIILITWFHEARRDILKLHPRRDKNLPMTGVFATRSPDRPNPFGLHRVSVLEVSCHRIKVGPIEAIDGTPVVDIKPVLSKSPDS